jgi:predicted GNAT family acetyltransferase
MRYRDITEVKRTSADNLSQDSVRYRLEQYTENYSSFTNTGDTIKGLPLYKKQGDSKLTLVIFDDEQQAVGYLNLLQKSPNAYHVSTTAVDRKYRRQGYMTELYKKAADIFGVEIVSDMTWTPSAEMLWKKLLQDRLNKIVWRDLDSGEEGQVRKSLPKGFFQDANMRLVLKP